MMFHRFLVWSLLFIVAGAGPVHAQEGTAGADTTTTQTDRLIEMRREKERTLEPAPPPGRLEKLLESVEDKMESGGPGGAGFMGFRPVLGGLRQGAGLSAGLAFEPFGRGGRTLLSVEAVGSVKKYWGVRALAGYRSTPLLIAGYGQYRHMPEERFFGRGPDSRLDQESSYRLNEADAGILAGLQLGSRFAFGAQAGYVRAQPGPGSADDIPTSQEIFGQLPGLVEDTEHLSLGGWLRFDGRDPAPQFRFFRELSPVESGLVRMPLTTKRGIFAVAEFTDYTPLGEEELGFQRLTVQSQQYIPFRNGYQVFALREFLALSRTDGSGMPFHMLPSLGGAYSLRGYELFRFRDRHALLLNAEYRWNVWRFADLVLFVDAGQVFGTAEDISVSDLHADYGGGLRLVSGTHGFARVEVARSSEGTQLLVLLTGFF